MNDRTLFRLALAIVAAVTLVRVIVLIVSPLNLYPDEAQYWWWAQTPDLGYFSKPPMIGWIVWLTTAIFGNAEWAIRLASPLIHAGTALLLFAVGKRAFDARVGFWSALAYLTLPGVSYSSVLISTDVPLLFFWALALYAFFRALEDPSWRWTVLCGAAIGFGMLSKYAMAYFVLCAILAAIAVPAARRFVFGVRGLAVLALGLLILSPNIWWNAQHHFATVGHTEHNADWTHAHFDPASILGFLGGQFGVFGPILMLGLIAGWWRVVRKSPRAPNELLLTAFSLPPILIITVQAFISEANANWAATAYIAAVPLAVAALLRWWKARGLWASFALNAVAMLVMWAVFAAPPVADTIGLGNAFKRMEGWRAVGQAVASEAAAKPYGAIATNNRSVIAELLYYAQPRNIPVLDWDRTPAVRDHFQMTLRLTPALGRHVLLAIDPASASTVLATFDSHALIRTVTIPVGGHRVRATALYDAHDYRGPQAHP